VISQLYEKLLKPTFNLEEMFEKIPSTKRGVLYHVIDFMIDSLENNEIKTKDICDFFEIKASSHIEDDFAIAYDNIGKNYLDIAKKSLRIDKIDIFGVLSRLEKGAFSKFCSTVEEEQQMEVIVLTAFILISGFAFVKWKSGQGQQQKILPEKRSVIPPNQPVPTAICLAVPASAVCDLTVGDLIKRDKIIRLIDESSDFLCIETKEAEKLSIDIDINQTPSPDNQLRFYIRIDISDGQYIIGEKSKYVIKRDLLPNIRGEIKELGRLKSISSISSFNRI
jgi:hypothetical protein